MKTGSKGKTEVEGGKKSRWVAGVREGGKEGGTDRLTDGGTEEWRLGPQCQQWREGRWERLGEGGELPDGLHSSRKEWVESRNFTLDPLA